MEGTALWSHLVTLRPGVLAMVLGRRERQLAPCIKLWYGKLGNEAPRGVTLVALLKFRQYLPLCIVGMLLRVHRSLAARAPLRRDALRWSMAYFFATAEHPIIRGYAFSMGAPTRLPHSVQEPS
jgi:hypothetical protein